MTAQIAGYSLTLDDGSEGGIDLGAKINPRFVSLSLSEAREEDADELQLVLQNHDGLLAVPETGARLNLQLGWLSGDEVTTGLVDKGQFIVDEVGEKGPPDVVTITARSADMTGAFRKLRTQSWRETTLGAIIRTIAARHSATARINAALAALPVDVIEQDGKSDMAFIRDLGRRYDAIATWKGGFLLFSPIGGSATAGGTPLDTITLTKRSGWAWSFKQADRDNYNGAEAQWQDQNAARRRTVGTGGDNRRKLKRVYANEAEARQAAEAAAARADRAPFTFTYDLAIADPALQPDMKVTLSGWNDRIDGISWLVKSVNTTFGDKGLLQRTELESA